MTCLGSDRQAARQLALAGFNSALDALEFGRRKQLIDDSSVSSIAARGLSPAEAYGQ